MKGGREWAEKLLCKILFISSRLDSKPFLRQICGEQKPSDKLASWKLASFGEFVNISAKVV